MASQKCFLTSLSSEDRECIKEECNAWNTDNKRCLILSFLDGYRQTQLMNLKVMSLYSELQKKLKTEDEEENE